jgi:penicillin-binding protein 1A
MTKAHEGMPIAELPGAYTGTTTAGEDLQPMENSGRPRTIVDLINDMFN